MRPVHHIENQKLNEQVIDEHGVRTPIVPGVRTYTTVRNLRLVSSCAEDSNHVPVLHLILYHR